MTAAEFNDWLSRGRAYLARRHSWVPDADKEEIVSEVIWQMLKLGRFDCENPKGYFFSSVRNGVVDLLRRGAGDRPLSLDDLPADSAPVSGGDPAETVCRRMEFAAAMGKLRPNYREALEIKALGYTIDATASMTGRTVPSVKKERWRAECKLRAALAEDGA